MSLIRSFNRLFALLLCAICLPAMAAGSDQTTPTPTNITAKIKLDELSMIIVSVSINGSVPYDFLLDTGCGKTMLDQKLADELQLPKIGERTMVAVMASAKMSVVQTASLSLGGATVSGLALFVSGQSPTVTRKVRGVLGEDFLQNFDVLIDYRHQVIRLESPLGSMAETAVGERLPLEVKGIYHGRPTPNRLVVAGHIRELGDKPMALLLDSGANGLTLFQDSLGPGATQQDSVQTGNFNKWVSSSAATRTVHSLGLGSHSISDVTVVSLDRRADVDTDGLVPTSLFHSIFISHTGKFAILDPSFPKTSR